MTGLFEAFNERREAVIKGLTALQRHAEAIGATTLANRIGRELVGKLREDRFHLVVVGEFNHGKTTFVNALLGKDALPVGVTPTTAVIHHVSHADAPKATLVQADGEQRDIAFEDLHTLAVGDERGASVKHVDVGFPAELLRDRIVLVDTPGVNDLCLQRADITYKYIPQSDAVLFVIDAGQPLKESERLFLKEKLLGQSRDKIIFVVAKADIWSEDEKAEALSYIRGELSKHIEGPVIFPVSANEALRGRREKSGMDELVRHLTAFLADERGRILLANAIGDGMQAASSIAYSIEAKRRTATMTVDDIDRRIARVELDMEGAQKTVDERKAAIREEAAAIRAWVRRDLDRFCDDVIRQLPDIIEKATVEELRIHMGSFLEHTFVEWAQREAEEVAQALEDLAERTVTLMQENAHETANRLGEGFNRDVNAPNIHVDTLGYDLGVFALLSVGMGTFLVSNLLLGSLMLGAAPALAYYFKGRVAAETREKAREQATMALREASANVAPKLEQMVDEFAERLTKWVAAAGKEVHQELLDVLQAARKARAEAEPDAAKVNESCAGMVTELGGIRTDLDGLLGRVMGGAHAPEAQSNPAA